VKYYVDALGDPETSAITEIERYCVEPGQACGYMLGKLEFLRLRDKAKVALGASSTSASSTTPYCSAAPCRSRSSRRSSTTTLRRNSLHRLDAPH